jgi:hypothetical protein
MRTGSARDRRVAILTSSFSSRSLDINHGKRACRISRRFDDKSLRDANSRIITRGSAEIDGYSYDLPSGIDALSDSSYTEFWYGLD